MKEKHRFNYYLNCPERTIEGLSNFYNIDEVVCREDLETILKERESSGKLWKEKFEKLLPILIKRFTETETQIFYSCLVSREKYTQTHTAKFVTYKDASGKKVNYTQAAVNGYIKRIRDIILREDKCYDCSIMFTNRVNELMAKTQNLQTFYSNNDESKLETVKKIKSKLKNMLNIYAIEEKIKNVPILLQLENKIEQLIILNNPNIKPLC